MRANRMTSAAFANMTFGLLRKLPNAFYAGSNNPIFTKNKILASFMNQLSRSFFCRNLRVHRNIRRVGSELSVALVLLLANLGTAQGRRKS